jgi:dihydroorotate dehydrogenase
VQIYTGLIYEGAGLIGRINDVLGRAVSRAGASSVTGLVGARRAEWAAKSIAA